jgi:PQQ-dependent catabolism-associated CXXCW motif protein
MNILHKHNTTLFSSSRRRPGPRQPSIRRRTTSPAQTLARLALLLALLFAPLPALAQTHLDPTTGYRVEHYRAPVPASVPGGTTITLETLQALVRHQRAILLDVTPLEGPGAAPSTGVWHVPKPRANMAGSTWLPDVGKGTLTPVLDTYFHSNLAALTNGDKSRPIVVYCQADCWMSWNAVKRAASYGYTALYWYPDGTDGMRDWDIPLAPATPVPIKMRH